MSRLLSTTMALRPPLSFCPKSNEEATLLAIETLMTTMMMTMKMTKRMKPLLQENEEEDMEAGVEEIQNEKVKRDIKRKNIPWDFWLGKELLCMSII